MSRSHAALLLLCLLLSLTACGKQEDPPAAPDTAAPREDTSLANTDDPESSGLTEDEARRTAFARVLRTAHDRRELPDGTVLDGGSVGDIEGNLFALHDVDGDGAEELILLWQNAAMAGQTEVVYGYGGETGQVVEELREFPGVIFYGGGAAEAPWSHNQNWANEFWPYTLYRHSPETDTYENMGSVDAWDKVLVSNGFPLDVDADGDGMVYVLLTDNWDFTHHQDPAGGEAYWYYEEPPVDGAEYLAWRDGVVGEAEALELSFMPLTAENIAQALDVPYEALVTTLTPDAAG